MNSCTHAHTHTHPLLINSRLFEEAKAQHETEKTKLTDELATLKETNQKIEIENQSLKLKITEHKSVIDTHKEKLGYVHFFSYLIQLCLNMKIKFMKIISVC